MSGPHRRARRPLAERLHRIHDGIRALLARYAPDEVAIERVFVSRNVDSALKLGQARGAALAALGAGRRAVYEYAPRARKQKLATVGFGGADKAQVQHMVGSCSARGPRRAAPMRPMRSPWRCAMRMPGGLPRSRAPSARARRCGRR